MKRILLDLDCTVSDFVGGLAGLWGTTRATLEKFQPAGEYDYGRALGQFAHERHGRLVPAKLTPTEFWTPINERPGFWRGLQKLPWADDLVAACRLLTGDVWFVTSPSRCPGCIREKEDWLREHYGVPHDRMIPAKHKYLLAGPDTVLIDDYDVNCKEFVTCPVRGRPTGGHAICLPAHHNHLHELKDEPLEYVLGALDSWARRLPQPYKCGCPAVRPETVSNFCPVHLQPFPGLTPTGPAYHGARN